jgi:hypothetical protein
MISAAIRSETRRVLKRDNHVQKRSKRLQNRLDSVSSELWKVSVENKFSVIMMLIIGCGSFSAIKTFSFSFDDSTPT